MSEHNKNNHETSKVNGMNYLELDDKQKIIWRMIDSRFSELLRREHGSNVYCGKEKLKGSVYDGCLDVARYVQSPIHVMWILKEHNDEPHSNNEGHFETFSDCVLKPDKFKKNVVRFRSLRLIERASRLLLNLPESDTTMAFKSVAIVNLGKCPGKNKTPDSRLDDLVEWWGDIIKRQVSDYKPDVVIVPGSHFSRVAKLLACNLEKGKFRKGRAMAELHANEDVPIIRIQHPSWYGCKEDDWIWVLLEAFTKAFPCVKLGKT